MSGLLGSIFSYGDDLKKRARGLLGDPVGYANATVGAFNDKAQASARALLAGKDKGGAQSIDALGAGPHALGGLLGGIKVFHGSPHVFDKADSSKIGTGEGAQAYGHGLYWAENQKVAEQYSKDLAEIEMFHNGKSTGIFDKSPAANAAHNLRVAQGDVEKAIKRATSIYEGQWRDSVISEIRRLGPGEVAERGTSNLYEANLRWPDAAREAKDPLGPQHFLDWDKPLAEQPHVLGAITRTDPKYAEKVKDWTGGNFWFGTKEPNVAPWAQPAMQPKGKAEADAKWLKSMGVPGISYLDQGSRAAGQGSRNYVTFDDALVELLSRNGQPLLGR